MRCEICRCTRRPTSAPTTIRIDTFKKQLKSRSPRLRSTTGTHSTLRSSYVAAMVVTEIEHPD